MTPRTVILRQLAIEERRAHTAYLVAVGRNKPAERLHRKWALAKARLDAWKS